MTIKLDVITAERVVFSDEVEEVLVPGAEGQLAILPHHAPLMTLLEPGELWIKKAGAAICLALGGGYLEVSRDGIIILADAAERAEEIDVARAESAKIHAQERLRHVGYGMDRDEAEAALRRALARLEVVSIRGKRPPI